MDWNSDFLNEQMIRLNNQLNLDWNGSTIKFMVDRLNFLTCMRMNCREFDFYFLRELDILKRMCISIEELKKYRVEEVCEIISDIYKTTFVSRNIAFYEYLCCQLEDLGLTDGRSVFKEWGE